MFFSVATGYGQPPSTIYDWALEPPSLRDADYRLPEDLAIRLRIEKFCDRVTKALYSSKPEPIEFISAEKLVIVQILETELRDMEVEFGRDISGETLPINFILTFLTCCLSNQHDSYPCRRATFPLLCLSWIKRSKRRSDKAFHRYHLVSRTGAGPGNFARGTYRPLHQLHSADDCLCSICLDEAVEK